LAFQLHFERVRQAMTQHPTVVGTVRDFEADFDEEFMSGKPTEVGDDAAFAKER